MSERVRSDKIAAGADERVPDRARDWPLGLLDTVAGKGRRWEKEVPPDILPTIAYVLEQLEPREKKIVYARCRDGLTLAEIGSGEGVTLEAVRAKEAIALQKLRHPTRLRLLQYGVQGAIRMAKEQALTEAASDVIDKLGIVAEAVQASGIPDLRETAVAKPKPPRSPLDAIASIHGVDRKDLPIECLDISKRAYNALHAAGALRVEQVACLVPEQFRQARNCGEGTIDEIRTVIGVCRGACGIEAPAPVPKPGPGPEPAPNPAPAVDEIGLLTLKARLETIEQAVLETARELSDARRQGTAAAQAMIQALQETRPADPAPQAPAGPDDGTMREISRMRRYNEYALNEILIELRGLQEAVRDNGIETDRARPDTDGRVPDVPWTARENGRMDADPTQKQRQEEISP